MSKPTTTQLPDTEIEELPHLGTPNVDGEKEVFGPKNENEENIEIDVGDVIVRQWEDVTGLELVLEINEQEYITWDLLEERYGSCKKHYLADDINDPGMEVESLNDPYNLREKTKKILSSKGQIVFDHSTERSFRDLISETLSTEFTDISVENNQFVLSEIKTSKDLEEIEIKEADPDKNAVEHKPQGHIEFDDLTSEPFRNLVRDTLESSEFISTETQPKGGKEVLVFEKIIYEED